MNNVRSIIEKMNEEKKNLEFLPTGFSNLDEHLDGGFMKKELVVVGGHTGIGKSFLAGQMLFNLAKKGFKTAYFSLEIASEMIVSRLIGALANIKPTRISAGFLTKEEYEQKLKAEAEVLIHEKYLSFYDDLYTLKEIQNEIQANEYEFVVIDFIQNVVIQGMDEYARLSEVSLNFQKLAKEKNCCVLVLSQLSNRVAATGSSVVEYKGSGSIAMVCDLGFFIERQTGQEQSSSQFQLNLRKNRRGSSGYAFQLQFNDPGGWIKEHEWA